MRSNFDRQLRQLNDEMLRMGTMIEENIQLAIRALVNGDVELAREIMERDEDIDKKQREIESICFQLLVRQQPVVAKDLLLITAAMKRVSKSYRSGLHWS